MAALKPRTTAGVMDVQWDGQDCRVCIPVEDDHGRLVFALSGDEAREIADLLGAVIDRDV